MYKDKLKKAKEKLNKQENENNKKTIENLVVFVIILIITIVAINYVWNGEKKEEKTLNTDVNTKLSLSNYTQDNQKDSQKSDDEKRIEEILSNIRGVGNVKILLTYSQTNQIIPIYDENISESTTEETDSGGGTRKVSQSNSKKDVKFEESGGSTKPIVQSVVKPKIEGAIVTAQGASDANVKTNIIQAVEAVTGLATYKIQVFEMKGEN